MSESKFRITTYTNNPKLKTVNHDWKGTPLDQNGDFMNHHQPMHMCFLDVLKWQSSKNPDKAVKKTDDFRLQVQDANGFITSTEDGLIWLGHASYLIRLAGVLLIIDPLFGSPSPLMKRLSNLPIDIRRLTNLDLILLSHDHRDHADEASMRQLAKQNPAVQYLTGLKVDTLLKSWTGSKKIQAAARAGIKVLQLTFPLLLHICLLAIGENDF
jgi:hypothetical protein